MGGHSADRVEEEECSVCANWGSWRSLALYYWGQYLVVVKQLGSDCSLYFSISRSDIRGEFDVTEELPSS